VRAGVTLQGHPSDLSMDTPDPSVSLICRVSGASQMCRGASRGVRISMGLRHLIIAVVVGVLVCPPPALAGGIVGSAGPSERAMVRGVSLQQGTNIFSGDVVEVGPGGEGVVTFGHNAMARFAELSAVRASKDARTIDLELLRGRMVFRTTPEQPVVGTFADALVRSENAQEGVAIVAFRNPSLVVVTAERGALAVTAGRERRTVTVPQGQSVEVALSDAPANAGNTPPAQTPDNDKSKKKGGGGMWWTTGVVLGGGAALGIGLALSSNQPSLTCAQKGALVSPYAFPCQ